MPAVVADVPTIKFERIERPCPHNKHLRDAMGAMTPRGLIYDFNVMIGGELRAVLRRKMIGTGYDLCDPDGRGIKDPEFTSRHAAEVDRQSDFELFISEYLAAGRIPTLRRAARRRRPGEGRPDRRHEDRESPARDRAARRRSIRRLEAGACGIAGR